MEQAPGANWCESDWQFFLEHQRTCRRHLPEGETLASLSEVAQRGDEARGIVSADQLRWRVVGAIAMRNARVEEGGERADATDRGDLVGLVPA